MIAIQEARYCGGFRIWLRFNNGESGETDLEDIIRRYSVAETLNTPEQFSQFFLDDWPTLAWACGFDLAPELLYERVTGCPPVWSHAKNNSIVAA
jgi:hypothetical protein